MKKLILNIIYALIPLTFAVLLLAFPSRTASILFIMLSVFILYGSLKELYFILKVDMLSDRLRLISVIKNAINIILSVVVLFLSFSKPDVLMDVVVYIIAIDLLLTAISDSVDYIVLRRLGFYDIVALDVILRYVFAILMFMFPSFISSTFIKIVAIIILILSVLFIAISIFSWKKKKDEIVVEYEEKD